MARRQEGGYPQESPTDDQQSQRALGAKILRAADPLSGTGVDSAITARSGDTPASPPPWPQAKSLAAGPHAIFRQAFNCELIWGGYGGFHKDSRLMLELEEKQRPGSPIGQNNPGGATGWSRSGLQNPRSRLKLFERIPSQDRYLS